MTKDSRQTGLLGRIIQVIIEAGEFKSYSSLEVMEMLKQRGEWSSRVAKTPARTIYSYFTQNPEIFKKAGLDAYRLQPEYKKKLQSDYHTDNFIVGAQYSRSDIYKILKVPSDKQGADWNNGYHREGSDYYIFCNVNTAGRTGHDYTNYWDEEILVWSGKTKSHFEQESIKKLLSDTYRKLIFYRTANQMPFTFAGVGTPKPHFDTNKPVRIDWAFPTTKQKPQMNEHSPFIKKTKTNSTQILKEKQQDDEQPTMGIQEAVELRLGLLSGQRHLEAFDRLSMQDVTDDEALCRIYDEAEIQCFSDFLALGEKRLKLRGYNQDSELTLKGSLRSYLRDHAPLNRGKSTAQKEPDSADKTSNRTPNATPTLVKQSVAGDLCDSQGSIQDAVELRLALLYGRNHLEAFDRLSMQDVTDEEELCRIYDESQIQSFSHFLALGKQRFLLPHYKQSSEHMLKDILRSFLRKITQKEQSEDSEQIAQSGINPLPIFEATSIEEQIPVIEPPNSPKQASSQPDFVAQLLDGSKRWELFDHKQMSDLTDDSALCAYYEKSQCKSLSEFLALSENRFDIRGYWQTCEEMLQFALRSHLTIETPVLPDEEKDETNPESPSVSTTAQAAPSHDEIESFVDELMAGRTTWQPLEQVEMKGLSSNNGLRYYYELSQCTNLSEFVALADKRFTIRGYWEGSEKRLKKELIKFFKSAQRKSSLIHNNRKKSTVDSDTGRIEVESAISDLQPTIKKTETPVLNVAEEAEPLTFEQRQEIVAELIEDEQRQEIVAELMKGSAHSDTFDELDINDITRDDGLCNCYNSKKPQSLSDFLAMGEKRLDIPDHDDESEKKLHEELTKFFESQASIDVYQNSTAQIEEDPTTVYGQNLEDVPAPTRSTKEQQNASPTAPTEKLSEASEDPPEISALPPTEIEDFVEDLLAGNIKWEPFKKKEMRNLTSNIVLRNIYKKSACANLSDFLAHSPKRRQWSQYWKKDQQLLKKELIRHFQLVSQTREVIENSPPERQTEKQATTKIESNSSHTSAESVKEVTEKLLSGDAGVEAFDHLCIGDISSNVRLENVYESSGVTNLSEFFAIGAKRMKIKNYGKLSERRLNEAVQRFLTNHSHEISSEYVRGVEGNESEAIDYDNILSSETPEKLISASTWKSWKLKLTDLRVMNEHVFYICQEIGENWPVKNGWQNKTIGDFCSSSLKELLSAKNFGKMKLRALIKAAAYLLTDRRKTILDQSPKERLHWLKNTIQLDKREQEIYVRRSKGETLDEIGRSLDVTRERIRQIQKGILFKYRSPLGLQICSDFLDQKQQSIWHSVAKGKLHLPKSTVLDINGLELTDMECFALFVYTGDKVKGERFSAIVAEFFNRRFQQTANHWIDLPYDAFDISAAISLAQSAINRTSTPIAFKELANRLPHIDQGLLRIAIQLSESINSFYGYLVRGRLTPRKRRAIGAHVTLNELEKNDIIVSTNTLLRAYSHAFGSDNCNERDIEVVMADHNHLFFKIGQEGWISTGTPGMTESKLLIANAELEEDEPETELNEASLKTQQIAEALTKTGIAHVTAIQKQLNYDGVHVPMTSIQPMLHSSELFVRFAPGFYGLKAHIQDQDAIKQARTTIIDSPINPRIPILQLRSYVFSRYAGEPKDVHILWGNEMEKLWAENLFEQEDDDLAKSFWFLLSPNDISKDPEIIERYKKRRANCQYKLNSNMPNINAAKRVDFDDILSSLVYLKKAGQISCARSNMLMGRRVDGLHSVSLLATLVLLDTVQPEDDWRKAHYLKGSIDELIQDLKDAYSRNPDINWETGLSKLLLPTIDSNMNLELYGWIKKINVDQLRDHFHPLEAVKPKQTVDLSVSTTRSPNGGIQI